MQELITMFNSSPVFMWVAIFVIVVLLLILVLLIVLLKSGNKKEEDEEENQLNLLQMQIREFENQLKIQQLEQKSHQAEVLNKFSQSIENRLNQTGNLVNQQLSNITDQLDRRMNENSKLSLSSSQHTDKKLEQTTTIISKVQEKLVEMSESSKQIFNLGQSLNELQNILKSPKPRGVLGEFFLADMLEQILPKEHYGLQYRFKSGETVDAVVKFDNNILPIDAKFTLDNFKRMSEVGEEEQKSFRKSFIRDIKKQIDSIAQKYILPEEGTLDLALMYIPAENVYYETIVRVEDEKESVSEYAIKKRVIPVSPNSLYTYLQLVLLGIRGLRIETGAKQILALFDSLQLEIAKINDNYQKIGTHLNHAQKSFSSTSQMLDKFSMKLQNNPANTKNV